MHRSAACDPVDSTHLLSQPVADASNMQAQHHESDYTLSIDDTGARPDECAPAWRSGSLPRSRFEVLSSSTQAVASIHCIVDENRPNQAETTPKNMNCSI